MARRKTHRVRDGNGKRAPHSGNWLIRHPFLALSILVLLVSTPTLQNKFVDFDDPLYLSGDVPVDLGLTWRGIELAFTSVSGTMYWQPLTWLSLEFDVAAFGNSLHGHHLVSILLHALTAGLLALLLRRLGASPYLALAGSALWALHPLRVESFAWIAERKDVLFAFFVVAALLLYTRYAESPSLKRFLLWMGCALLALMSKPTAMVLPVILILLDWWPLHRIRIPRQLPQSVGGAPAAGTVAAPSGRASIWILGRWIPLLDKIPVAAASLAVLLYSVSEHRLAGATGMLSGLSFATRLSNAVVGYVRYLGMIVWPASLGCLYPYVKPIPLIEVAPSALLLGLITLVTVYQWRRRPWLLMGWLWFLLTCLPNPGQAIADRFTEIPMIGLIIALTWTLSEVLNFRPQWKKPIAWGTVAALAALSLLTVRQIGYWRDSETLFRHAIAVSDTALMRYNLALVLEKEDRNAEAEADFKAAISLDPRQARNHNDYALLLIKMNRPDEAVAQAQAAVKADPNSPLAAKTLAQALLRRGDLEGAFAGYDRSIALGGDAPLIAAFLNDYGASLAKKDEFHDGELLIRKSVQLDPSLVEARRNLVLVLVKQQRNGEARAALVQAIEQTGKQRIYEGLASQVAPN